MTTATRQISRTTRRLFPLHLTPFEYYMLADDRPAYPMTFLVRMELSGTLNTFVLEDALDDALRRHPLLRAVVKPAKGNMECWVDSARSASCLQWQEIDAPLLAGQPEFIDLRQQSGLRIWVQHDESRAIVTMQFHHAACDGIGAYQFIGDWLYAYAARMGANDLPAQATFDTAALRNRFRESIDLSKFAGSDGTVEVDWAEFNRMEQTQAQPLRPSTDSSAAATFPGLAAATIAKDDFRQLRHHAQEQGLTPNDWGIVQFLRTLHDWNQSDGGPSSESGARPISALVPLSLRPGRDSSLSACNVVTYAILSREDGMFADDSNLCRSVREEVSAFKSHRYESEFMFMITGCRFQPAALSKMLDPANCLATGILANVGDPTKHFHVRLPTSGGKAQCGNLTLESLYGVPPLRPNTRVTAALVTYRRHLTVCMRCDPHHFGVRDTDDLLARFMSRLRLGGVASA